MDELRQMVILCQRLVRRSLLISTLLINGYSWAQPNYVPDPIFRQWLNGAVPGLVGSDGYITQPGAHLNLELTVSWEPWDLTGLEFLNVDTFRLNIYDDAPEGILPAFSPGTTMLVLSYGGSTPLPPFPPQLESLACSTTILDQDQFPAIPAGVRFMGLGGPFTALPPLPDGLDWLMLTGLPALTSVTGLPDGLRMLGIGESGVAQVDVPANVEVLSLGLLPQMIHVPALPAGLDTLWLHSLPLVELPTLPDLTSLSWFFIPSETMSALPNTLRYLEVTDNDQLLEVPPLPDGLETFIVAFNHAMHCVPWLPASLTYFGTDLPCVPNQPLGIGPQTLCTLLSSYCPEPNPRISGHLFIDVDDDGVQDMDEPDAYNVTLQVMPTGHMTGTDSAGNYSVGLPIGVHTITMVTIYLMNPRKNDGSACLSGTYYEPRFTRAVG